MKSLKTEQIWNKYVFHPVVCLKQFPLVSSYLKRGAGPTGELVGLGNIVKS